MHQLPVHRSYLYMYIAPQALYIFQEVTYIIHEVLLAFSFHERSAKAKCGFLSPSYDPYTSGSLAKRDTIEMNLNTMNFTDRN